MASDEAWQYQQTASGSVFYWNSVTNETSWERPKVGVWHQEQNDFGEVFYWNSVTNESTWDRPEEFEDAPLERGTEVECRFNGGQIWYRGVICKILDNGCYDVRYADGDRERNVQKSFVRVVQPGTEAKKSSNVWIVTNKYTKGSGEKLTTGEAAALGESSLVIDRLEAGHNANAMTDAFYGRRLLHEAARYGHAEVVSKLLSAKADPNRPDVYGQTAIEMAAQLNPRNRKVQLVQCINCSKWRKIPVHAIASKRFKCFHNKWDPTRAHCVEPQEPLDHLEPNTNRYDHHPLGLLAPQDNQREALLAMSSHIQAARQKAREEANAVTHQWTADGKYVLTQRWQDIVNKRVEASGGPPKKSTKINWDATIRKTMLQHTNVRVRTGTYQPPKRLEALKHKHVTALKSDHKGSPNATTVAGGPTQLQPLRVSTASGGRRMVGRSHSARRHGGVSGSDKKGADASLADAHRRVPLGATGLQAQAVKAMRWSKNWTKDREKKILAVTWLQSRWRGLLDRERFQELDQKRAVERSRKLRMENKAAREAYYKLHPLQRMRDMNENMLKKSPKSTRRSPKVKSPTRRGRTRSRRGSTSRRTKR